MTTNKKLQVATVTSIGALIAMIVTGWLFVDERYAHATDMRTMEQGMVQTVQTLRVQIVLDELSRLEAKKANAVLTTYEKVREKQLEKQFKLLTGE